MCSWGVLFNYFYYCWNSRLVFQITNHVYLYCRCENSVAYHLVIWSIERSSCHKPLTHSLSYSWGANAQLPPVVFDIFLHRDIPVFPLSGLSPIVLLCILPSSMDVTCNSHKIFPYLTKPTTISYNISPPILEKSNYYWWFSGSSERML